MQAVHQIVHIPGVVLAVSCFRIFLRSDNPVLFIKTDGLYRNIQHLGNIADFVFFHGCLLPLPRFSGKNVHRYCPQERRKGSGDHILRVTFQITFHILCDDLHQA